jgi:hypothetical protein
MFATYRPSRYRYALLAGHYLFLSLLLMPATARAVGYNFVSIVDNDSGLNPELTTRLQRKINDSGEVTFLTEPFFATHRIYKGNGGGLTEVASSSYWGLDVSGNGAIDDAGYVYFRGGSTAFEVGIYRSDGNTTELIISGEQGTTPGNKISFSDISVSNSGQVAWRQDTSSCGETMCDPTGSSYNAIINGSGVTLAQKGGTWSAIGSYAPIINDLGQALITMTSAATGHLHLLRYDGPGLTTIDTDFDGVKGFWMNSAGDVVFAEVDAVRLFHNGSITTVASTADGFDALIPSGSGEAFINDSGDVAFWGSVSEYQGNPVNFDGVYTGPDIAGDRVLVYGDSVLGHTIGHIELLGLNNAGQLLLSVEAQGANPWRALVVASPNGDYNGDHVTDAADYVIWRKNGGTQQEYNFWRANFGNNYGTGAGFSTAVVPEPGSLSLLLIAAAGTLGVIRSPRT